MQSVLKKQLFNSKGFGKGTKVPPDLIDIVENGMKSHILNLIGLANKAGLIIFGFDKIKDAVEKIDWYSIKQPLLSDLNIYKDKIDEEYPYHSLVEFRKYAFQYIKGLGNVKEKKRMLLEVKTVKSFKEILNQLGDL